ncbi:dihydrolipoamide acetyltransferase family protein [Plantibacter sp. Mn2098]|uniref:dihydrolipoamide acetyltransferase family protein n=1 Tax=Plantibacter sp. Mn2098 TaxID=3395266 RepID=UPI003BCDA2AB
MINIHMPRLSDTMEEGAIAVWHKRPGDRVEVGDLLVEIETDKATMEHEAYEAGVLSRVLVAEGELAAIGTVIAVLDDGSGAEVGAAQVASAAPAASTPADAAPAVVERRFSSPLARKTAREQGIDLALVRGSGPGGRIVRADVLDAVEMRSQPAVSGRSVSVRSVSEQQAEAEPTPVSTGEHVTEVGSTAHVAPAPSHPVDGRDSTPEPFDSSRRIIAKRLTESMSSTPHFFVTAVADVEELVALRARLNDGRPAERRISVNDLLVRAVAIALREHPGVNASYSPEGGGRTMLHGRVNIGVAVAAPSGLIVPVIRDADQVTVSRIGSETKRLVAAARERRLGMADLADGTFTISNLGMFGIEQFTAVINPPEGAILAVGATVQEPVVMDGAVVVRHRMRLTLSADHRIIDGALAAGFLATLADVLSRPLDVIA